MDRVMLIDSCNFGYKANVVFKPKPQVEGYEDNKEAPVKPNAPEADVVVYNYFRNLRALIEPFLPLHKVIDVREGHPAFRYELLPEYKANRIVKTGSTATASDIAKGASKARFNAAYPEIKRLMKLLPISTAMHKNYEADDTIFSLVEDLKDEDVIVVSGDSDLIQLLQLGYKNLRLYHPIKKVMVQAPDYHYLTWKCLAGDKKSDNVPGCMGDKTARKLIASPEKLKEWLEKTEENRSNFARNKALIELAKVPLDEIEFESNTADYDRLKIEFEQLEFKTITTNPYWAKFVKTFQAIKF